MPQANEIETLEMIGSVEFEAAAEGSTPSLPKLKIVGYNGGILRSGYFGPVIVDLAGMEATAPRPILRQHDSGAVVGHVTEIVNNGKSLTMSGIASGVGKDAQEVIASAKNGFPWQASIGADMLVRQDVGQGVSIKCNGQTFTGPLTLITKSKLKEVSVTPNGLDDGTSVRITAAKAAERDSMPEPTKTAASGAADDASKKEKDIKLEASEDKPVPAPAKDDATATMRLNAAAESTRLGEIYKASGEYRKTIEASALATLEAAAISDGRTIREYRLDLREAERPKAPAGHIKDRSMDTSILQAAFDVACGVKNVYTSRQNGVSEPVKLEAAYGDQIMSTVDRQFRRGLGLQELMLQCAVNNGYSGPQHHPEIRDLLEAAFSSSALSTLLTTTGNKILLESFMSVEQVWKEISDIRPVNDFKAITSFRLGAGGAYEEVTAAGEIKQGSLSQTSRTNQAKTYGQMLVITRQQLVNDDLGAFQQIPSLLGRNGALALNTKFWTKFLADTSFYTAGNANYISGSTTTLLSDLVGLALGEKKGLDMVDDASNPMPIQADILLVPTALSVVARQIYVSTLVNTGGSSSKDQVVNANIYQSKYRPLVSAYLTGSAVAWYLLQSAPSMMRPMQTVFLNGQQTPIIENAEADFNVLGIQMRGYYDFGCELLEPRGSIKSKGAA